MTTDPAIQIIAKAIYDNVKGMTDMPLRGPEDFTPDAADVLEALRAAGYWVAKWEPIEAAPKDGTEVVAVIAGSHPQTGRPFVPEVVEWDIDVWWNEMWASDAGNIFRPTHFMPLPPPPAAGSENGGGG